MRAVQDFIRGVPMRWAEHGEGFPVVLVHGIPTNPSLWRHVVPLVRGRCFALEMVGYGDSIAAGEGRDISVARQADYLLAWMDALGIDRAVFAGHDLGGGVLQIAAVTQRARCAGLLLTNTIAYDSWPVPPVQAMRKVRGVLPSLPSAMLRPAFAALLRGGHDSAEIAAESFQVLWPPYSTGEGGKGLARQLRWLRTDDTLSIAPLLPDLDVPTRIVWATGDIYQKVEAGLPYARRLAWDLGTTVQTIDGGRHFTPENHPDVIADAINDLLPA